MFVLANSSLNVRMTQSCRIIRNVYVVRAPCACPLRPRPLSPQVDPLTQSVKRENGQGDQTYPGLELI